MFTANNLQNCIDIDLFSIVPWNYFVVTNAIIINAVNVIVILINE